MFDINEGVDFTNLLPTEIAIIFGAYLKVSQYQYTGVDQIIVNSSGLEQLLLLEKSEPDLVQIWSTQERDEYPYLVEAPNQIGVFNSLPLVLDHSMHDPVGFHTRVGSTYTVGWITL